MAENSGVMSNRDKRVARMREKYPDKEFVDDEELFGQINDDYDGYDEELSGYRDRESKLSEFFASNPRSAAFLMDWKNGGDPIIELVRKFGPDFTEAMKDPERQEALAVASKEYAERVSESKRYEEEYTANLAETISLLDALEAEGVSVEEIDQAMEFLYGIMKDAIVGKFSRESIEMALKAIHHDEDVALAEEEGEVRGRNAKITEKLRKSSQGDGTANLGGKNGSVSSEPRQATSIFDIAQGAK